MKCVRVSVIKYLHEKKGNGWVYLRGWTA
jgi:hypothetical protein